MPLLAAFPKEGERLEREGLFVLEVDVDSEDVEQVGEDIDASVQEPYKPPLPRAEDRA